MGGLMNLAAVEAATQQALDAGMRVFNGALFGIDEASHVAVILQAMKPPPGAVVLDVGCGVGETAKLMAAARPDLTFKLLNISAVQLAHCPAEMERIQADFDAIPLPTGSVDVVLFSYTLCHSADWRVTLREARRVLKDGGILFVNDLARVSGDNSKFERLLGGRAHSAELVDAWAWEAGFDLDATFTPVVQLERLATMLVPDIAETLLHGVVPTMWRFTKLNNIAAAFNRHTRIAFQFSGGRDSTATLYLLRDYWPRMRIYHVDSGDQFPETRAVVERVAQDVHIEIIRSDVKRFRDEVGLASDLVPADNTPIGRLVSGRQVKLVGRYDCCAANIMAPMHNRMLQDGNTLLVRGQRDEEFSTPPMRSGDRAGELEFLYPLQDWTGEQVEAYLRSNDLPIADFYPEGITRASDCLTCTAWWDDGRAQYLRRFHPQEHVIFLKNIEIVRGEINRQADMLTSELAA